jgi:DNA-binding CsgD family transcriptional regulator
LGRLIKNHIIDEIRKKQRFGEFIGGDKLLENVRTTDVQKIEQIAEIEWRVHIVSLALKNVSSFFSDRAMKAFSMSMEGVETRQIATQLRIKPNSVIKLRNRVKYRVIKEIQYLRNKLK